MTLSASAIINGLTMLRAYNSGVTVTIDENAMHVRGVNVSTIHPDDYTRLIDEDWSESPDQSGLTVWWYKGKTE
jgi:hypothetical protein